MLASWLATRCRQSFLAVSGQSNDRNKGPSSFQLLQNHPLNTLAASPFFFTMSRLARFGMQEVKNGLFLGKDRP
jgi:hypothetical protein